jgi:hypothetical protein
VVKPRPEAAAAAASATCDAAGGDGDLHFDLATRAQRAAARLLPPVRALWCARAVLCFCARSARATSTASALFLLLCELFSCALVQPGSACLS